VGASVALLVAVQLQIRYVEEPHLLVGLLVRLPDYAACVGQFIPRIGRLASSEPDSVPEHPAT